MTSINVAEIMVKDVINPVRAVGGDYHPRRLLAGDVIGNSPLSTRYDFTVDLEWNLPPGLAARRRFTFI